MFSKSLGWPLWKGHLTPRGVMIHKLRTAELEEQAYGSSRVFISEKKGHYLPWTHVWSSHVYVKPQRTITCDLSAVLNHNQLHLNPFQDHTWEARSGRKEKDLLIHLLALNWQQQIWCSVVVAEVWAGVGLKSSINIHGWFVKKVILSASVSLSLAYRPTKPRRGSTANWQVKSLLNANLATLRPLGGVEKMQECWMRSAWWFLAAQLA